MLLERLESRVNLSAAPTMPAIDLPGGEEGSSLWLASAATPPSQQIASLTTSSAAVVAAFTAKNRAWTSAVDVVVPSLPDATSLRLQVTGGLTFWNGRQAPRFVPARANVRTELSLGGQTLHARAGEPQPHDAATLTLAAAATNQVAARITVAGQPARAPTAGFYAVSATIVAPNGGPATPVTLLFSIGAVPAGSRAAAIRSVGGVGSKPTAVTVGVTLASPPAVAPIVVPPVASASASPPTAAAQPRGSAAPQPYVPPAVNGIAEISGNITRDTTFVAGTVYVITGEVHVWRYKTLTIEDGVEVRIRNGRGQFTYLTSRALIFDSGSSLVAQSVIFQAANDNNEPVNVADNGGVFFCGGTQAASKDNVSSQVVGGPLTFWSFQATKITANYLGRKDPAGGDGDGPKLDDIDALSVIGVVESEWKIASVESNYSGDDGFDLTNSHITLQHVRVVNPTEDGVNLTSSTVSIEKSFFVDMTDNPTPLDRELFDFENDFCMITVYKGADVNLLGFWDDSPFDRRIYLQSKDMDQPTPLERKLYSWSDTLKLGSAFIYSPSNSK